jgi:hypothetical protein
MGEDVEAQRLPVETAVKPVSTEKTLAELKPRQVEAEEGSKHTIYTFKTKDGKPVEILFYSPNELPLVEEVKGKFVLINGEDPRWRTGEEWEEFSFGTLEASDNQALRERSYAQQAKEIVDSGKGMLLVESSPEALLETAKQIGFELESPLQEALSSLESRQLTKDGLDVIDSVLAGNLVDDEGRFRERHDHEGEALYLLSLMVNEEAKGVLDKKREMIQEMDRERDEAEKVKFTEQRKKDEEKGQEALKLKSLVAVHATRHLPIQGEEGLEVATTFEASDWKIPRDTIHFSLNHHVAPHMYGSWSDTPYAVISPLKEMMETNGNPAVLNTVDTFWEVGPGKRLRLPESIGAIVQPGDLPRGEVLSGVETGDIRYKVVDLEPVDIAALSKELSDRGRSNLNTSLLRNFTDTFSRYPLGKQIEVSEEQAESLAEVTGIFENHLDIFSALQERSAVDVVRNILSAAKIEVAEREREMIAKKIEGELVANIKRVAVEKKIMQMGYEVHSGGMWAWGDSWEVTYKTVALGAKLEVPVMAHTDHISARVEGVSIGGLGVLLNKERTPEVKMRVREFEGDKIRIRKEFVPEVTQDTRRMLYLTGLI